MWARLRVTGERQWSRFDLDGSESEVTVIKGCSELLLAPGASINEWHETAVRCRDRQGRRNDGGQVTAAHTRPSPVMSSAGIRQRVGTGDRCAHMHTGYVWRCQNTQPPTKHSQSEDILSKGCVYCRINHQLFHYIIHVLSRPHLYPRASYRFFFSLPPPTHSDSHTRIMHRYKPQWQFSLIPSFPPLQRILLGNCWECGNEAISGIPAS